MKKSNKRFVAIVLLAAFGLWLVFTVLPSGSSDKQARKNVNGVEPKFTKEAVLAVLDSTGNDTIKVFDIELAESMNEIQYGMMYRKSMNPNTGMLFLMGGEDRRQSFYMKNTYVPLDIIFINKQMEIVSIQKNAEPLNEPSLPSTGPASYVLELLGGESDKQGISAGNKISWERWNK